MSRRAGSELRSGASVGGSPVMELGHEFAILHRRAVLEEWKLLSGQPSDGPLAWQLRINRLLSSPGLLDKVREARASNFDPTSAREMEVLERLVTDVLIEQHPSVARLRARLQRRIVAYRPRWNGQRVNRAMVRDRLRLSSDRGERERAWRSQASLERSLESGLRDLARVRNARARELGFGSFPEYRLRFEGFSIARLEELLDGLGRWCEQAARARRAAFERVTGLTDFFPWDEAYAEEIEQAIPAGSFQARNMVSAVLAGTRRWGFGPTSLNFRIDRHDLYSGGISIPVDPPDDIRVIVHPSAGWVRYMILFHEVGHSVHSRSNAKQPPFLKCYDYVPGFFGFVEGVGTLFEEIPRSARWLRGRPRFDAVSAERVSRVQNLGNLAGVARLVSHVRLELKLYRNPDADLEAEQYRWFQRLGAWDRFDPPSFADTFFVNNPVYLPSYLFANLFAKQLLETMVEELGEPVWPNPRFGPWLVDHWFRQSGTFDWVPEIGRVSGKRFSIQAFGRWAKRALSTEA